MAAPNPFLAPAGDPAVLILDGGLATTLEARGFDLNDDLWSAKLLVDAPEAVRQVHHDFLAAGADVIATVSYQASLAGFAKRGISRDQGVELLRRSVRLAVEARDAFWAVAENRRGRRRPLVAASVGPYGAYLADGSEYTGEYPASDDELYDFHRERWHLFAQSEADLLACETIPSGRETAVLVRLLRETPDTPAWVSFSCRDTRRLADGTRIQEAVALCDQVPNCVATGVNCIKPELVVPLLEELRRCTDKPLLVYPNAGEDYDVSSRSWVSTPSCADWVSAGPEWVRAGARGIGGCCRVAPRDIAALRAALHA